MDDRRLTELLDLFAHKLIEAMRLNTPERTTEVRRAYRRYNLLCDIQTAHGCQAGSRF